MGGYARYTEHVNYNEDPKILARIEALADRDHRSRADTIRHLVRLGLQAAEDTPAAAEPR